MVASWINIPLLGIDIGGTYVRVALAQGQHIIKRKSSAWTLHATATDDFLLLVDLVRNLIIEAKFHEPIHAIGVALAALTDRDGNVIHWPNRPTWNGLAFKARLEQALHIPVVVEDDANAAALAEWLVGAGQGFEHLLVIMAGTGIGSGIILHNNLVKGSHNWAGELGHIIMMRNGPLCTCGKRGCLQALASGRMLEQVAKKRGVSHVSDIEAAAIDGVDWACQVMIDCGYWLGLAAANTVNLLNLQAVIVGGGLSKLSGPLWTTLEMTFQQNITNTLYQQVTLHRSNLSDTAGLIGALSMAQRSLTE